MSINSNTIKKAVEQFSSLPSIGKKTAQRLVFHLLKQDEEEIIDFANSIISMTQNVSLCDVCFSYLDKDEVCLCFDNRRKTNIICVVEQPSDIEIIENTGDYFGNYHVLHGILNPLEGISPDDLKIKELIKRLTTVDEVILALNPTVEGEVTIQYLTKIIKPLDIKISRIASGVPLGSSIEFADLATLSRALEGRITI